MAIIWNAEPMATGVHEVDEQHQELIRHFNWIQNHICSVDIQLRGCVTSHR